MGEVMSVQWFPGHMAKTRRKIAEDLKLVDVVAEILDARIPQSSSNPVLRDIIRSKPRVVLLNKSDMADPSETAKWVARYQQQGLKAIPIESKTGKGIPAFYNGARQVLAEQIATWERKGMVGRPIRVMVLGVPNVGKSSFINRIMGKGGGKAEVRDKPGVTRQNRWFAVGRGFELLDTPGVLWPKFEDPIVGEHLAFTGAVKDEILDLEGLACRLLELLQTRYPKCLEQRYKLQLDPQRPLQGYELLERIGRNRGMLVSGGEINTERAAITLLDEYRGGKLGPITLEPA